MAVFVVQMSLNIFGSCNLIPFTGVTIPFISEGGTSMLTSGILLGFLKATVEFALRRDDLSGDFAEYLKTIVKDL